jgi:hypothetical protein
MKNECEDRLETWAVSFCKKFVLKEFGELLCYYQERRKKRRKGRREVDETMESGFLKWTIKESM